MLIKEILENLINEMNYIHMFHYINLFNMIIESINKDENKFIKINVEDETIELKYNPQLRQLNKLKVNNIDILSFIDDFQMKNITVKYFY